MSFPTQQISVTHNSSNYTFSYRPDTSDLTVIQQVFENQDYNTDRLNRGKELRTVYEGILANNRIPAIIDLGANIGASSIYFHLRWPKAQVNAVEPAADNFDLLQQNCGAYPKIKAIRAAAASQDGYATIVDNCAEKWAYRTNILKKMKSDLPALSMPSLMTSVDNSTPFICKIDIEGAEAELFSKDPDWVDLFPLLIIELHDWMLPGKGSSQPFQKVHATLDRDLILGGENLFSISNKLVD